MVPYKKEVSRKPNPTKEFYLLFQFLYEYLNKKLFEGELPNCMIEVTRKKNTFGYFQPEQWVSKERGEKLRSDTIAMNPFFFENRPLIEVIQTLTHEMVHLWQFHFGVKDSLRTYHNKEWAAKMESIGLIPSDTGLPGGKKTGQKMMDYPGKDGNFIKVANKIAKHKKFKTLWFDRIKKKSHLNDEPENIELTDDPRYSNLDIEPSLLEIQINDDFEVIEQSQSKSKYHCPGCDSKVWGRKNLNLICGDCAMEYIWSNGEELEPKENITESEITNLKDDESE